MKHNSNITNKLNPNKPNRRQMVHLAFSGIAYLCGGFIGWQLSQKLLTFLYNIF